MVKVKIAQFEGPLDLLLRLIEDQKLDITQISLAHVTEQFLQHLRSLQNLNPRNLADWLVIAAKLLVIKSKTLVPTLELDEEDREAASGLTWQLYQYKRYKEAARHLQSLDRAARQGWGRRQIEMAEKTRFYPDPDINAATIRDAMRYLAKSLAEIAAIPKKILGEVVTITEKIDHLQKLISQRIEMKLHDLLSASKSKTEIIVTFLALLELVKQKILTVEQEIIFSDIVIKKR